MPDTDTKPSAIGGFELLATLGKGGMGVVFKARQVSMDRIVALKVLPPNLAKDETYVSRFLREARSAAKLNHPNIVQGIDVGEAGGHYYFAMEFVDGFTVKELIRRQGRIEEKQALNIVVGVARALEHAAKHGIIHRDIKPDNIMISREGAVKLADLGLARTVEKPDTLTIEGTALGTPYYMAPEQIRGTTQLDTRTDIYALGVTLFHMVTGEFPYDGPNAGAIMARHLADPVPSAKEKQPEVTRAADQLIQRMMAKDPADRPQTPGELLQEIKDALAGKVKLHSRVAQPPSAVVGGHLPRESQPRAAVPHQPKSKTTLIAAGVIVGILLIAGLVLALRPGSKPDSAARPSSSVPQPPTPNTQHPTPAAKPPEDARKTTPVVVVDDAEAKRKAAEFAEKERIAKAQEEAAATERQQAEELRRKAEAALAAYQAESDKVWTFFKERNYPEAEKALAALAAKPEFSGSKSSPHAPREDPVTRSVTATCQADLEAAKLLKEFWTAVERGVMARKGKFVSIAGKGGNVESVADGQVTLKVGAKEFTQPLLGMAAAQAAALADLKDDERGNLVKAIFLLAEGEKLDDAEKLLAAAGKAPAVPVYKDRLDRILGRAKAIAEAKDAEGREAAARDAWRQIGPASKGDLTKAQATRLLTSLDAFEAKYGATKLAESVHDERAALRPRLEELAEAETPRPPVEPGAADLEQGLLAVYYKGSNMDRFVAAQPFSGVLNINWGPNAPLPEMPADNFSTRFVGWLKIDEAGKYTFEFPVHDDGARLYLDGKKVIDEWGVAREGKPQTVALTKGLHRLWVEHTEGIGMAAVVLNWYEGGKTVNVPADRFYCERKLLDAVRQNPTRNPLLGMKPTDRVRAPQPEPPPKEGPGQWQSLFDGKSLDGWRVATFAEHGRVRVDDGVMVLEKGNRFTGVAPTRRLPMMDYEIAFEVKPAAGGEFASLVFPCGGTHGRWFLGTQHTDMGNFADPTVKAWRAVDLPPERWYACRLRVSRQSIGAWVDDLRLIEVPTQRFGPGWEAWIPLGGSDFLLYTGEPTISVRNIRFRRLGTETEPRGEGPKP